MEQTFQLFADQMLSHFLAITFSSFMWLSHLWIGDSISDVAGGNGTLDLVWIKLKFFAKHTHIVVLWYTVESTVYVATYYVPKLTIYIDFNINNSFFEHFSEAHHFNGIINGTEHSTGFGIEVIFFRIFT